MAAHLREVLREHSQLHAVAERTPALPQVDRTCGAARAFDAVNGECICSATGASAWAAPAPAIAFSSVDLPARHSTRLTVACATCMVVNAWVSKPKQSQERRASSVGPEHQDPLPSLHHHIHTCVGA